MTNFLDTLPLDFRRPEVQELQALLASNYFRVRDVVGLLQDAGINPAHVELEGPMSSVWHDILVVARRQDRLRVLLVQIANGTDQAVATRVSELLSNQPVLPAPTASADPRWINFGVRADERIIGAESTLLDVAFLARGVDLAAAVCRLLVTIAGDRFYGTGFRIREDLLLTNHHVLFSDVGVRASAVEAWFGYERTFAGRTRAHQIVHGQPDTIRGNADSDWAVVRIAPPLPVDAAIIDLSDTASVSVDDRVYIIQHPNGGVKKIGMIHNTVRYADDCVVQYLTDTDGGSSGSPVFNEHWQLVALHHRWVSIRNGGSVEVRNQGRSIQRIVNELGTAGIL